MKRITVLPLLLVVLLALAACVPVTAPAPAAAPAVEPTAAPAAEMAGEDPATMVNIVEAAQEAGQFTTLLAAAEAAGLVEALSGDGPLTVFAPTDEAFAALPAGTVESLLADPQGALTQILLYHVVPGKVMAADVTDGLEAETLQGGILRFTVSDGVMVNDANVIATDVAASNGVIHVIDSVLLPPSDEAAADAMAEATPAPAAEPAAELADIVDTAVAAGSYPTLVAAVQAAGLVDALKAEGPYTVFAPTEEAFAALPAGTLESLLADPQGALTQILLYHVVPGKVMAADLADGAMATTLQGADVHFMVHGDGAAMVNEANIVATDIETSNGVIHVIDAVILPPTE